MPGSEPSPPVPDRPGLALIPSGPLGTSAMSRRARRAREVLDGMLERRWPWAILLVVVGTVLITPRLGMLRPRYSVGEIARSDLVAPHDLVVPDEELTRSRREAAAHEVAQVYVFEADAAAAQERALADAFAAARSRLSTWRQANARRSAAADVGDPAGELAQTLRRAFAEQHIELAPRVIRALTRHDFSPELEQSIASVVGKALRRGVADNKSLLMESRNRGIMVRDSVTGAASMRYDVFAVIDYRKELRPFLEEELVSPVRLAAAERAALAETLAANVLPNLKFDAAATTRARVRAREAVDPVLRRIPRGKVIVRRGDEVTPAALTQLRAWRSAPGGDPRPAAILGTAAIVALLAFLWWLFLDRYQRSRPNTYSMIVLLTLLHLAFIRLMLVVAWSVGSSVTMPPWNDVGSYAYAIPFAAAAVAVYLLSGISVAVMYSVVFSLLAGMLMGQGVAFVLYSLVSSLVGIYAMGQLERRVTVARAGALVGFANVYTALALGLLGDGVRAPASLAVDALSAFAGGILTAVLVSFAIPLLESLFHATTVIRLLELTNQNLPLLRRLALEAPGTYQHSLMVGNLAQAAAEAIGAHALLARVRGYYHDVGKCRRPEYFVENQRGHNKHDKLAPSMSWLVLSNHVSDGVELARQAGLPETVVAGIREHHGTKAARFFFEKAKELYGEEQVRESDFRYGGPLPQDKENGILMLADSVEAASRTLTEPTPAKIKQMIRTILDDALRDRQLDACDLTLREVDKIADTFLWVLASAAHQRIDYPGFEFNKERGRKGDATASTAPRSGGRNR